MARKIVLSLFFWGIISSSAFAQYYSTEYRPPNQNWQFLKTPHFKLIYPEGNDSSALRMGQILEQQYPAVQNLVGGELNNFPIILKDYNDRSNGFVTPIHFRSEIELPPSKGKTLSPRNGGWLYNVGPHELVHAMQFSNLGDANIPNLLKFISPDLARSTHSMMPPGIIEGLAVYHESNNVRNHGGRGNFAMFTNQFDAVFKSDSRWSLAQMVQPPNSSRPFGRYYIGGYEFTSWLQHEFGDETSRQALDFFLDWPFLGYGTALRHATGFWPGKLYDQFEQARSDSLNQIAELPSRNKLIELPLSGIEVHRPKLLSDSKIMFYGSFYNARPGFYSYDLETKKLKRLIATNSTEDYRYDLSADHSEMVFSYYEANPIYNSTEKIELVNYNFEKDNSRQITKNGRLYAPLFMGDSLWALQTKPAASRLVSLSPSPRTSQNVEEIASLGSYEIIAVDHHPQTNKLAIVVNKSGKQALWIANPNNIEEQLKGTPDVAFSNGSIYDPEWHPSGSRLLFSSDVTGTHRMYEYDTENNAVAQITGSAMNASEGSYSPDGNQVAFVRQVKNEQLPALLNRTNFLNQPLPKSAWQSTESQSEIEKQPFVSDSMATQSRTWKTGAYSTGIDWLKPRSILPVVEEVQNQNVYQVGLGIYSNSTLADQLYSAELTYLEDRQWFNLTYQNKSFFPGFKVQLYSEPSYLSTNALGTLLRQERSLALSAPTEFRLNQNVYKTSVYLEPKMRRSQVRYFDLDNMNTNSGFTDLTAGGIYTQFNYRVQQNIRDLQPNSGLILYAEIEQYLGADNIAFSNGDNSFEIISGKNTALGGGIITYISPLRRWNQSLRLRLRGITQTGYVFNKQEIVSDAFSESVLTRSNNLLSLSGRYTIPLLHVDDGGFTVPIYLGKIYLVGFANSVADPTLDNWFERSRSVFGAGIRAEFRFGNILFDLGVGYGYEPTRKQSQVFIGDF